MDSRPHVIIIGAGPAGLGAAFRLAARGLFRLTVIEEREGVGGAASSFELDGIRVDYGSHRLHPSCDPGILGDIKALLGDDLLLRPRHGRIRLRERWIHFPLKPLDLALRLPPGFAVGAAADLITRPFRRAAKDAAEDSFATSIEGCLGRTISDDFYFPYAQKIWGLPPEEISAIQARRRVSANSVGKMLRKIFSALPGAGKNGAGTFYYPRGGFGQISEALFNGAREEGAEFMLGTRVSTILSEEGSVKGICCENDGGTFSLSGDLYFSTMPITHLVRYTEPSPPLRVMKAADKIFYRSMILVYLVLGIKRFSEYDAHYFPGLEFPVTRISEPKNYSAASDPDDRTILCAELPCSASDPEWTMSDDELGGVVLGCLEKAGIPVRAKVVRVLTRRLPQAYPIYRKGYEVHLNTIEDWLGGVNNLVSLGRQGLFVHDNTHHALYMGYAVSRCIGMGGEFDRVRWQEHRKVFETHVVED